MRPEDRLSRAPAPDAEGARERARRVVVATPPAAARRRRRWMLPVLSAALAAVALAPSGNAIASWFHDLVTSQPAPARAHLGNLPAAGRLLVTGPAGAAVIRRDGSRTRIGDFGDVAWSPMGLFVAGTTGRELRAVEPDGTLRWTVTAAAPVTDPVWAPSGYRIAYRSAGGERIVAGDGSGDHALTGGAAQILPAWRPGPSHELALVRSGGAVELWSADQSERLWRRQAASPVALAWAGRGRLLIMGPTAITVVDGSGRLAHRIALGGPPVTAAALAPNGREIALARGNVVSTMRLRDTRTQQVRWTADAPVRSLAFSPDGQHLLVAARNWAFLRVTPSRTEPRVTDPGASVAVAGWCCAPAPDAPLAATDLRDGRRIELRWSSSPAGPCLILSGIDEFARRCGYAPSSLRPFPGTALNPGAMAQRRAGAPLELYGSVSAAVDRVLLRYGARGRQTESAVILRARDRVVLQRARIAEPFGYFFAQLPHDARNITATALDERGKAITSAFYDELTGMDPHAFIAAGPGELEPSHGPIRPLPRIRVAPPLPRRFDRIHISFRTPRTNEPIEDFHAEAHTNQPAARCVNERDRTFEAGEPGLRTRTALRLADGEGGETGWCAGRYHGTVTYRDQGGSTIAYGRPFTFSVR